LKGRLIRMAKIKQNKKELKNNILADIDDEIWLLKKRIQLKYDLSWASARDYTNWALRSLMCSYEDKWIKNHERIEKI